MSQGIFLDPIVSSAPTLAPGSAGNGTLTVDKLSHFTITQSYTAVCTATDPFTVFNIIASLDGPVGVAIVGQQFMDQDSKVFLTINQGPTLFEVGDTFEFSVLQGTDVTQSNLDTYDELPQKNFGAGIIGQNAGDHNLRFNEASQLAFRDIQDLKFTSKIVGADGNAISIEYLVGTYLTSAQRTIQDLTFEAVAPGVAGNAVTIEYEDFTPAIQATVTVQDVQYTAKEEGTLGNTYSIEYVGGGTAGSEVASLIGDKVRVQIEDGVSTADEIRLAILTNPTTFAVMDAISTGTGLESQTIQAEIFLTGGVDSIGAAGSEVVTVLGNAITVKFESGVSSAQQVYDAIFAEPAALSLLTPTITGVPSTVQVAPEGPLNLLGGTEDSGIPGSEVVQVVGNQIIVTFVPGDSTAQQIKTAIEANLAANALVTVTLLGIGDEFQNSPVSRTFLGGGLGTGTYAFNSNELSDAGNFYEGNAAILVTNITNQGNETTLGNTLKRGKVTLDDNEPANQSGPLVENTQKTVNNLIQNGKAILISENEGNVIWSKPAASLISDEAIKIIFTETGVVNTILANNFPLNINEGEHLWVIVDRLNTTNLTLFQGTEVPNSPNGENVFRLVTRVGTSLVWWDNTLQREGKKIRIGEGAGTGAFQEKLGVGNGLQSAFPILSGLFPVNRESILVFANAHQFVADDWTWDENANEIVFVDPPEAGVEIYVYYLTDGDSVVPPSLSGVLQSYVHIVSATETMNKELQLVSIPAQPSKMLVDIVGGTSQVIGVDFQVSGDLFQWTGFALDGELSGGDQIRFHFFS